MRINPSLADPRKSRGGIESENMYAKPDPQELHCNITHVKYCVCFITKKIGNLRKLFRTRFRFSYFFPGPFSNKQHTRTYWSAFCCHSDKSVQHFEADCLNFKQVEADRGARREAALWRQQPGGGIIVAAPSRRHIAFGAAARKIITVRKKKKKTPEKKQIKFTWQEATCSPRRQARVVYCGAVIYSSSLPGDEAPSWEPLILPSITCAAVTPSRRRERPLNASAQYAGL